MFFSIYEQQSMSAGERNTEKVALWSGTGGYLLLRGWMRRAGCHFTLQKNENFRNITGPYLFYFHSLCCRDAHQENSNMLFCLGRERRIGCRRRRRPKSTWSSINCATRRRPWWTREKERELSISLRNQRPLISLPVLSCLFCRPRLKR